MEENHKNLAGAVLVGCLNDDFVHFSVKILAQYEIKPVFCENIYSAVAYLSKNGLKKVLVAGKLSDFSRENAKLFEIARRNSHVCCCLADRQVENEIAAAAIGSYVINDASQFEEVLRDLFNDGQVLPAGKAKNMPAEFNIGAATGKSGEARKNVPGGFNRNDFAPTKAELDALLGRADR